MQLMSEQKPKPGRARSHGNAMPDEAGYGQRPGNWPHSVTARMERFGNRAFLVLPTSAPSQFERVAELADAQPGNAIPRNRSVGGPPKPQSCRRRAGSNPAALIQFGRR